MLTILLTFLLLAISPTPAGAGETSLGEVTVHADQGKEAQSEPAFDSVAFTTILTSKDLRERKTSLSETLQDLSGVQIKRYGGLDDFATVSIRGSTSEQVAVFLDGISLNQGINGTVNLATIPVEQIERIEIYKGSAPARFGSSTLGGVLHIVTRKGVLPDAGKRETRVMQSYGSFQTYEGGISHWESREGFRYQVDYHFGRSRGDFSFRNNNGTPFNESDDTDQDRRNNEFARHNLSTSLEHTLFSLHNRFFREDRGIPGFATLTSDLADLSTLRNATYLEVGKKGIFGRLDLVLSPFFQFQKQQFSDPEGEIGLGTQDSDDDTYQYGSSLRGSLMVGAHQRLNLNTEYRGEKFLPEDFSQSPSSQAGSNRNSVSIGLEDEIFLLEDRLVFNPSLRTEQVFNDFSAGTNSTFHPVSGKIGLKYRPVDPLTVRTNFSRAYRIPNFSELFGDQGTFVGNPNLVPEKGWNWDVGGMFRRGPVSFELAWFLNHVEDLIQLLQTSQFTVQARNLTDARIQGIESALWITPLAWLDLSGNYTFQWAKDTSGLPGTDGKFLPGRPRHEFSLKANAHNRWGRLFADLSWMDDNFLDTQNILRVDDRLILGVGATTTLFKRFTMTFEAKNLSNNRISDVVGFPLPGRSFYGKLTIKI